MKLHGFLPFEDTSGEYKATQHWSSHKPMTDAELEEQKERGILSKWYEKGNLVEKTKKVEMKKDFVFETFQLTIYRAKKAIAAHQCKPWDDTVFDDDTASVGGASVSTSASSTS